MSPETGRRFGPYEIQSRLGGGGMGHVYLAWDARLHREVAIKLLQNDYAMPGMRERFLREARAASALNHPNICTIFDIGEQNGDPYLVMELLEGETLRDRIRDRSMSTEEICCVAREVADALGAAHAKGVIHRDVKPANIFLVKRPNGSFQAKVLDFGLAKIEGGVLGARGSRSMDITTVGATVGTLAYMSPEQARGETLDSRSDLFSLGVVLYEMATRHVPFQGATSALVFVKLLNHPPEPVREWNESVPRDLEKIINKLLAKERAARFQTAQELVQALAQVNDKPSSGPAQWLRKAVATVPLGRGGDQATRERPHTSPVQPEAEGASSSAPAAAEKSSSDAPLFLRPVARVPRGDTSARPGSQTAGTGSGTAGVDASTAGTGSGTTSARRGVPADSSGAGRSAASPAPGSGTSSTFSRDSAAAAVPVAGFAAPAASARGSRELTEQARLARSAVQQSGQKHASTTGSAQTEAAAKSEGSHSAGRAVARTSSSRAVLVADSAAAVPLQTSPTADRPAHGRKQAERVHLTPLRLGLGLVVLLVLVAGAIVALNHWRLRPTMLTEQDTVLLTQIENRTGNSLLDGSVAAGLAQALAQSPYLRLLGPRVYLAAQRMVADQNATPARSALEAARASGATAFLLGSIRGEQAPYTLHVDLFNTGSNELMSSVEEPVTSLTEIAGAIDRVASDLRANAGEDDDSIARNTVPLARDATANLDALHAFAQGEAAQVQGRPLDAVKAYQQAIRLEPRFVMAHLRLVTLYRRERAEANAADAARTALGAADATGERTRSLAQFAYEINSSRDFPRATAIVRHYLLSAPHDAEALADLAQSLRLQGHMAEALQAAQQSYGEDPFNTEAYRQAQEALISLDRYDAAYQLEGQAERLGVSRVGGTLMAAYLEGRDDTLAGAATAFEARKTTYAPDWSYGIYLDNGGRLQAADALWRLRAGQAGQIAGLESAAGYLLAQGALDQALAGSCAPALALAQAAAEQEQGAGALFNEGMADALCGDLPAAGHAMDQLRHGWPQGFDVNNYFLPDIRAALALHDNDPVTALDVLRPARQFDLLSLTPWLRGRAHVQLRQVQIGIVDFQTVLAHRGSTFIVGSNVYPIAEIGVARAFADTGDLSNSAEAYRRFLELWKNADPGQPMLAEARQHLH